MCWAVYVRGLCKEMRWVIASYGFAFMGLEIHLPCGFTLLEQVKVSLGEFAVAGCLDRLINAAVVIKKSSCRIRGG